MTSAKVESGSTSAGRGPPPEKNCQAAKPPPAMSTTATTDATTATSPRVLRRAGWRLRLGQGGSVLGHGFPPAKAGDEYQRRCIGVRSSLAGSRALPEPRGRHGARAPRRSATPRQCPGRAASAASETWAPSVSSRSAAISSPGPSASPTWTITQEARPPPSATRTTISSGSRRRQTSRTTPLSRPPTSGDHEEPAVDADLLDQLLGRASRGVTGLGDLRQRRRPATRPAPRRSPATANQTSDDERVARQRPATERCGRLRARTGSGDVVRAGVVIPGIRGRAGA